MAEIQLKPGREKSLLRRHPWIFSGAIDKVVGASSSGETVNVISSNGEFLAYAAYSPHSSIRARVWSFDQNGEINEEFIHNQLRIAITKRNPLLNLDNNACRLVHAESDALPGLILDKYNDALVVQYLSAGAELWRETIMLSLREITNMDNIYERSDAEVRNLEGLETREGILSGNFSSPFIEILENGMKFRVDVASGQKTGFFLDQRDNRRVIQKYSNGRSVLNCFSYTGAFTVYALKAQAAQVTTIESSEDANKLAMENIEINDLPLEKITTITGDVFKELRLLRDRAQGFDVIILDPPKFAPTAAQVRSAARGYKDINLLAFKLLNPGGILATFSCSGGVSQDLFQKIVADAALDAGVDAQIIDQLTQGPDHPIALNFPEGAYLKGLICRIN